MNALGLAILKFLASRKTAIGSVLVSLLLYLSGDGADHQIADTFRISLDSADRITDFAKFIVTILAMAGFSPLVDPRRIESEREMKALLRRPPARPHIVKDDEL